MISKTVAEMVLNEESLPAAVDSLVEQANEVRGSDKDRMRLLGMSSVALGAERGAAQCLALLLQNNRTLMEVTNSLGAIISLLDTPELVTQVKTIADTIKKLSTDQTDILCDLFNTRNAAEMGLPKDLAVKCSLGGISDADAIRAGMCVYANNKLYFLAWYVLRQQDKLQELKCRCANCVSNGFQDWRFRNRNEEVENPMLDKDPAELMRDFGREISHSMNEKLTDLRQGIYEEQSESEGMTNAPDFMESLLKRLTRE